MELLEYKNKLFELLKIEDISQLPKALEKITDNQKQRYIELFGLDRDWIRELYQYYLADRDGLKQDYTFDEWRDWFRKIKFLIINFWMNYRS